MDAVPPGALATALAALGGLMALVAGAGLAWRARGMLQAASVGCVAAGVALLALPWHAPPVTPPDPAVPAIDGTLAVSTDGRRTVARPARTPPPPLPGREVVRIEVEATEAEPNDTLAGANVAPLGVSILGIAAEGDVDSFAFDVTGGGRKVVVATLSTRDASAAILLFDDAGRPLGRARTIDEIRVRMATLERPLDAARYYVQVVGLSPAPAAYQLTLTAGRNR